MKSVISPFVSALMCSIISLNLLSFLLSVCVAFVLKVAVEDDNSVSLLCSDKRCLMKDETLVFKVNYLD